MILNVFLIFVFFICLAMIFSEGLWSATISLINVITAAMLATNFFEPVATFLTNQATGLTFFWDFVAVWAVFIISLVVMQLITGFLSRYRVRFKKPVDIAGGVFCAAWIGWIMMQFTLFTLHVSPLGKNFLAGSFQPEPTARMFFGLAPDRNWLAFMHTMSESGSLTRGSKDHVFDPRADFVLKYAARRQQFEAEPKLTVGR